MGCIILADRDRVRMRHFDWCKLRIGKGGAYGDRFCYCVWAFSL